MKAFLAILIILFQKQTKRRASTRLFGQIQCNFAAHARKPLRKQRLPRRIAQQILPHLDSDIGNEVRRSEEHTSELQSLMRISYAVFCLKKKKKHHIQPLVI